MEMFIVLTVITVYILLQTSLMDRMVKNQTSKIQKDKLDILNQFTKQHPTTKKYIDGALENIHIEESYKYSPGYIIPILTIVLLFIRFKCGMDLVKNASFSDMSQALCIICVSCLILVLFNILIYYLIINRYEYIGDHEMIQIMHESLSQHSDILSHKPAVAIDEKVDNAIHKL